MLPPISAFERDHSNLMPADISDFSGSRNSPTLPVIGAKKSVLHESTSLSSPTPLQSAPKNSALREFRVRVCVCVCVCVCVSVCVSATVPLGSTGAACLCRCKRERGRESEERSPRLLSCKTRLFSSAENVSGRGSERFDAKPTDRKLFTLHCH